MWNIIIGGVFIVGALSGKLVLIGTNSSLALGVIGSGMVAWGAYKMVQQRQA